jgi:outer membrane protein assembly factor BamB
MKRWPRLLRLDLLRVGMLLGVAALAGCGKGGGDGGSASAPSAGSVPSSPSVVDVATYHNDTARTGQNLNETLLTPANVNAASFGKVGFYPVDGKVDAQPLVLSTLSIAGTTHTVLFVATEHATVFALDADSGAPLWKTSALAPGESPSDDHSCGQITPEIGITATPVVDRARGPHGAIYVVAMSKDGSGGYHQRSTSRQAPNSSAVRPKSPPRIPATARIVRTGAWYSIRSNTPSGPRCCC